MTVFGPSEVDMMMREIVVVAAIRHVVEPTDGNMAVLRAVALGSRALQMMGDSMDSNAVLFTEAIDAVDAARETATDDGTRYHLHGYANALSQAGMDGGGLHVSEFRRLQVFYDDLDVNRAVDYPTA